MRGPTVDPIAQTRTRWLMLAALAVAQCLGMSLWFSATAVTPILIKEFGMSDSHASWLTIAVQAGFVAGTLMSAVTNLSDVLNARVLFFLGALTGAAVNAAVLLTSAPAAVITLRFLTGAALACVYPPGMKIAAGWFRTRRGFALGILIGALTLGKAFPYLLTSFFAAQWRAPMLLVSAFAIVAGVLVVTVVRDGPYVAHTSPFDPHAIRRIAANRGARLATLGYLGHMWELYAMWTWVVVFAAASFAASGVRPAVASLAAFVAIGSGAIGCAFAGWFADSLGRARIAIWAMWTSAACCAMTPLVFGRAPFWLFLLVTVWGFSIVADSAQFSALVSEYSPADHVGTALTLQTCLGFLLTTVTIELLPRAAAVVGWQYAAWLLVPGPLAGIAAMRGLVRRP